MTNTTNNETVVNPPADNGGGALDGLEEIVLMILEQEALVLGIGLLGLGAYFLYKRFEDEDMFEGKDPDEVTRKWLKHELKNGQKVSKKLIEKNNGNLITRGKIQYEYYDKMPDETISPVIDPESNNDEEFEPSESIYLAKVLPENESLIKFVVYDVIMDKDEVSEYYILKEDNLEIYENEVIIREGVNLDYDRGVFNDRTTESKNKANQIIRMESQNELVRGHLNYAEKVNYLSPTHSMDIDKINESKEESEDI